MKPIEFFALFLSTSSVPVERKPSAQEMRYAKAVIEQSPPGTWDEVIRSAERMIISARTERTGIYVKAEVFTEAQRIREEAHRICARLGWKPMFEPVKIFDGRTGTHRYRYGEVHTVNDGPKYVGREVCYPWG